MNTRPTSTQSKTGWLICIALSLIAYTGMVSVDWRFGTLRDQFTPQTISWYLLAFAAFLLAAIWVERRGSIPTAYIWIPAILFRVLLLFTTPTLSDDVYRYLWDGYVATQGVSPYAYAIDSAELDPLDNPTRQLANNAWMASPYMPAAQLIFVTLATALPLNPLFMQIGMVIFDLLAAFILTKLLALAQLPAHRSMLYLWNPLIIVEVAHGAHIDAWMVFLTLLTLWLTLKPNQTSQAKWAAPIIFALATLTKIIPVLALPILFWRWSWRQLIGYSVLTLALLVPFGQQAGWGLGGEMTGQGLFGALRIYSDQWKFNSGIWYWLQRYLAQNPDVADSAQLAKQFVFFMMLAVMIVVWLLAYRNSSPRRDLRLLFVPFTAYIMLTPTVHPWYTLMMMAFLIFLAPASTENRWRWLTLAPWLYLAATLIFSYMTYVDPVAHGEQVWVRQLEWLPTLALATLVLGLLPFIIKPPISGHLAESNTRHS